MRTLSLVLALAAVLALPGDSAGRMSRRRLAAELRRAPESEKPLIIKALGRARGRKRAARELVDIFDIRGGSPELSTAIVRSLGELESPEATAALLDAWEYLMKLRFRMAGLPAHLQTLRAAVAESLGRIGEEKALPALRRGMIDEDSRVVRRSIEALGRMRDAQSVDWMVRLLSSADRDAAQSAYEALGAVGGEKAEAALRAALEDGEPAVRVMASYGLARMDRRIGFIMLDGFLEEVAEPYKDGVLAAYYLARLDKKRGREYLLPIIEDASPLRLLAVEALGKSGDLNAVPALSRLLEDESFEVRLAAVLALGRLGANKARRAVEKSAGDPDPGVRAAARAALAAMGEYEPPAKE